MLLLVNPAMRLDVSFITLLVAILAVWRITHLFSSEDGPADIFLRLRRLAGKSFFGQLLDCFYCLSLWFAAPVGWLLGETWLARVFIWLAVSGGAILLERITARNDNKPPPAIWHESPISNKSVEEESK
ncbi:MAG TPA: DUF1360 domain-containing protein [Pyrinomonadaceae bacterium]